MIKKSAQYGEFEITVQENGSIKVYREYSNTKQALREIADKVGFKQEEGWNTRTFGNKLIDYLNNNE